MAWKLKITSLEHAFSITADYKLLSCDVNSTNSSWIAQLTANCTDHSFIEAHCGDEYQHRHRRRINPKLKTFSMSPKPQCLITIEPSSLISAKAGKNERISEAESTMKERKKAMKWKLFQQWRNCIYIRQWNRKPYGVFKNFFLHFSFNNRIKFHLWVNNGGWSIKGITFLCCFPPPSIKWRSLFVVNALWRRRLFVCTFAVQQQQQHQPHLKHSNCYPQDTFLTSLQDCLKTLRMMTRLHTEWYSFDSQSDQWQTKVLKIH